MVRQLAFAAWSVFVCWVSAGCTGTSSTPAASGAGDPTVRATDAGAVRGVAQGGTLAFEGIPYAAPPVGSLRWRAPQPPNRWDGVRDATAYGAPCVQTDASGAVVGSEDCLTLNVWTPASPPSTPLPVLFFVHGGNNQTGCSCDAYAGVPYYDGRYLSEHGPAVVVTVNYRLGAFGFLADPAFAGENAQHSTGNYGLRDLLLALAWVQRDVGAFGGDPSHVLLFGQSAGANDIAALFVSPGGKGLFAGVAMHSGPGVVVAAPAVEATWRAAEHALACDGAADVASCLRASSASAVAAVPGAVVGPPDPSGAEYDPIVDGDVLQAGPIDSVRAGNFARVPLVVGTTANEYAELADVFVRPPVADPTGYENALLALFGATLAAQVSAHYPVADYSSAHEALVMVLGDSLITCPTRRFARAVASAPGHAPVRRFLYAHSFSGALASYGAAHGFDVVLLFHDTGMFAATSADAALSDAFGAYWSRDAATGDPNGGGAPPWPEYDPAADSYLTLDWPVGSGAGLRAAQCDWWDTMAGG
jgi:para-nitrobenzyl esterase